MESINISSSILDGQGISLGGVEAAIDYICNDPDKYEPDLTEVKNVNTKRLVKTPIKIIKPEKPKITHEMALSKFSILPKSESIVHDEFVDIQMSKIKDTGEFNVSFDDFSDDTSTTDDTNETIFDEQNNNNDSTDTIKDDEDTENDDSEDIDSAAVALNISKMIASQGLVTSNEDNEDSEDSEEDYTDEDDKDSIDNEDSEDSEEDYTDEDDKGTESTDKLAVKETSDINDIKDDDEDLGEYIDDEESDEDDEESDEEDSDDTTDEEDNNNEIESNTDEVGNESVDSVKVNNIETLNTDDISEIGQLKETLASNKKPMQSSKDDTALNQALNKKGGVSKIIENKNSSDSDIADLIDKTNKAVEVSSEAKVIKVSKYDRYDNMQVIKLYDEVKAFMIDLGVSKRAIDIEALNNQFGEQNIRKLIQKSYLIKIGKGVTVGL